MSYLQLASISHNPGPPHSPQLNGAAKQTNHTIGNLLCAALPSSNMPKSFWANALAHALHLLNSIPCHTPLGWKCPNTILDIPLVNISHLHPFGCLTWFKAPVANCSSLRANGCSAVLLSYITDGNRYRLWDLQQRTVVKLQDIIFEDAVFPYGMHLEPRPIPICIELHWLSGHTSMPSLPTPLPSPPSPGIVNPPCMQQLIFLLTFL